MAKSGEMIPNEMIKLIAHYDGNPKLTHLFLKIYKCEYLLSMYKGKKDQDKFNFQVITSRFTGNAASLIGEREDIKTYNDLKAVIKQHFGNLLSEENLSLKLMNTMKKHN